MTTPSSVEWLKNTLAKYSTYYDEDALNNCSQAIEAHIKQVEVEARESAEYWKPYDALYDVSTIGRVRRNGKILKQSNRLGYRCVTLSAGNEQKSVNVHRLIAATFIPNPYPQKPCVNHIDGDKANNNVNNLEWCTYSENELHSFVVLGKRNSQAKLLPGQVKIIKSALDKGETLNSLAKRFSVHKTLISQIKRGLIWKLDSPHQKIINKLRGSA